MSETCIYLLPRSNRRWQRQGRLVFNFIGRKIFGSFHDPPVKWISPDTTELQKLDESPSHHNEFFIPNSEPNKKLPGRAIWGTREERSFRGGQFGGAAYVSKDAILLVVARGMQHRFANWKSMWNIRMHFSHTPGHVSFLNPKTSQICLTVRSRYDPIELHRTLVTLSRPLSSPLFAGAKRLRLAIDPRRKQDPCTIHSPVNNPSVTWYLC